MKYQITIYAETSDGLDDFVVHTFEENNRAKAYQIASAINNGEDEFYRCSNVCARVIALKAEDAEIGLNKFFAYFQEAAQ